MRKTNSYTYITAALGMLVPAPGRLAYGLVLVLIMNLLLLFGTLFRKLAHVLGLDELQPVLVAVVLMALAVLCKQILILLSPPAGLVLGFAVYMPAVSSFIIGCLYDVSREPLLAELGGNMRQGAQFSLFALLVFLFRDVFGYGTVTLPSAGGVRELAVSHANSEGASLGVFWASIPGALVLLALALAAASYVERKFQMVREASGRAGDGAQ